MKKINRLIALILVSVILTVSLPKYAYADSSICKTFGVLVNGNEVGTIPVLDVNYENNIFISINGLAHYLKDTVKGFTPSVTTNEININTYDSCDFDSNSWGESDGSRNRWKLVRPSLYVNDVERKYYAVVGEDDSNGRKDAFFTPLSLSIILDIKINISDDKVIINTDVPFSISDVELENSGYLQGVNSLLIGDGTTGNLYFEYEAGKPFPIASTTKLMTYFVMMDAVTNGEMSLEDNAIVSNEARVLSEGIDGLVSFSGVSEVPINELIYGMLLSSSNECALLIAEHVSGSEEAFVQRMNEKAIELGMEDAEFYNCNGLPVYEAQFLPAKMQNHMSAKSMFTLASELVKTYPQVLDITSKKTAPMSSIGFEAKNTNALLYNMVECKGLKTGTTNKSGACVIECLPVEKDGVVHNLICVLFGAEGEYDRATVAEIAARIALEEVDGVVVETEEKYTITPDDPEIDVKRMLRHLK